jgi:hypothetical protein
MTHDHPQCRAAKIIIAHDHPQCLAAKIISAPEILLGMRSLRTWKSWIEFSCIHEGLVCLWQADRKERKAAVGIKHREFFRKMMVGEVPKTSGECFRKINHLWVATKNKVRLRRINVGTQSVFRKIVGTDNRECLGKIVGAENREFLMKIVGAKNTEFLRKICGWVPEADSVLGRLWVPKTESFLGRNFVHVYQKQRVS